MAAQTADVKAIAARKRFSSLPAERRCCTDCPGWTVSGAAELQVCNACWDREEDVPTDDDVALLAEARWALEGAAAAVTIADIRNVLWPGGNAGSEWSPDTVDAIAGLLRGAGFGPKTPRKSRARGARS